MSQTIQIQKLQTAKKLTLVLKKAKKSLAPPGSDDQETHHNALVMVDKVIDNAKADFNSLADAAHTEMISNRLDEAFDEMIANLNKERDSAKSSLNGLTKQQQEELAGFWTGIITLMSELAKKMAALYAEILNKIRAGWKITREELNEFFSKTKEKVHKVFVQQPAQCSMGRFHFTFQIK